MKIFHCPVFSFLNILFLEILLYIVIKQFCSLWIFSCFWSKAGKCLCRRANFSLMISSTLIFSFKDSFCSFYLNHTISNWLKVFCTKLVQNKIVSLKKLSKIILTSFLYTFTYKITFQGNCSSLVEI